MTRNRRARWALVAVVATAALTLLAGAGSVPLMDPDESRFARTSVEMMRGGDLVVPRFQGEPRLVKPPLLHWVQSSIFRVLGVGEASARLHSVLATLGSILLVAWIARRRFGEEAAPWAAAILAAMPLALLPGRLGTIDALLAVHVLAVIALDITEDEGRYRSAAIGGLLGLAFLTKGPIGVVLPLLSMLAGRTAVGRPVWPSGVGALQAVAAWCVVVLPWGLAFLRRVGVETALGTVRGEALDRYFAGTTHVEPPWFYAKVFLVGFLPWIAPLLLGLVRAWRLRRDPSARTATYAAAALVAGFVFFSLGKGKLPSYVLPLAPFAALVATWELGREIEEARENNTGPLMLAASTAGLAVLMALLAAFGTAGAARTTAIAGALCYGLAAPVSGLLAVRRRPRGVYGAAAAAGLMFLLAVVTMLLPSIGQRKSAAGLIAAVPALASGRPIVTFDMKVPSLTFYLDRIPEVLDPARLAARLDAADDPLWVFDQVDLPVVPRGTAVRLREVGRQGKYVVFEKKSE